MARHAYRILCAAVLLVAAAALIEAKQDRTCPADPFSDPRNDPCNPLRYIPSNTLSAIALSHYVFVGLVHIASTIKWGAVWMSALTIGCFTYALGIALRFGLHSNPDSSGLYIVEYLFVTLTPCAFIAAEYILLGRLAVYLKEEKHLLVSPRRITPFFVASDIITFLIQSGGGGISAAAKDEHTGQIGSRIFLVGLVLQFISFVAFFCVFLTFLYRVRSRSPSTWLRDAEMKKSRSSDWRILALAMLVSCIGIIIRSLYRVIELSQGFVGSIATNEGLFYGLDSLPLFIAVVVYIPFWPGRFINTHVAPEDRAVEDIVMGERVAERGEAGAYMPNYTSK